MAKKRKSASPRDTVKKEQSAGDLLSPYIVNKLQKLSPKQIEFINSYIDPKSDTFSNQTKSYRKAYSHNGDMKDTNAASNSNRLLRNENVSDVLTKIYSVLGMDILDSIQNLTAISRGAAERTTLMYKYIHPKDGGTPIRTLYRESVTTPTFSERIRIVRGYENSNKVLWGRSARGRGVKARGWDICDVSRIRSKFVEIVISERVRMENGKYEQIDLGKIQICSVPKYREGEGEHVMETIKGLNYSGTNVWVMVGKGRYEYAYTLIRMMIRVPIEG
jgi:hypothetical protein